MTGATGSVAVVRDGRDVADQLAAAWRGGDTFAVLPSKTPLTDAEVAAALDAIPPACRRGHYVLLTSGSTGTPKFVVGRVERTAALARVLHEAQALADVREAVVALPLTYSYAFVNQLVWAAEHGRRLTTTDGLADPAALLDVLRGARDAMLCLTGAQVPLLLRAVGDEQFAGVTRLMFAGGRFPQEQLPRLHERFPSARVFNNYGCAEALPRLTLRPAEAADEAGDIGWPLAGVELRAGAGGALEFRSPYRAVGLVQDARWRPLDDAEWLPTGDLGEPGEAGRWRLLGRSGEVFKRYGEKVSLPALLAAVLREWDGEAAFGLERDRQGEAAHVLALAPLPAADVVRRILRALRAGFPRAAWPVRIVGLDALPRLGTGKIDAGAAAADPSARLLWRQHL